MVTAPHHLAAEAGLSVLREGGNAIEAMVAAASTIAVVYPHMNSIGGDTIQMIHEGLKETLRIAVLAGFPDRVAKRRAPGSSEVLLASGGAAKMSPASAVRDAPLLLAVDVEERRGQGRLVRLASAVEPEWLLDLFPDYLKERATLEWNRVAERVEAAQALLYGSLVIEESRGRVPDPEQAAQLLFEHAREAALSSRDQPLADYAP